MDDISARLAEILNDPDSMKSLNEMAENLLGSQNAQSDNSSAEQGSFFDGFDPAMISKIMNIMSRLKSNSRDNRADLLLALKPHLSAPRREKVDTAIKLLKIIDLLPLIKETDLFNF